MKPDATIHVTMHAGTGRWAYMIDSVHYLAQSGAGRILSATTHTGLAIALVSALDTFTNTTRALHLVRTGEYKDVTDALSKGRKLRLAIATTNKGFYSGVQAMARREPDRLRVSREVSRYLRKRIQQFETTLVQESDTPERLARFARRILPAERFSGSILPALTINAA